MFFVIKLSDTSKQIILFMIAIALVFMGIGAFIISSGKVPYIKGLLFGTIFSILKLILLEKTLNKAMDMNIKNASNYTRLHYSLRYFLTGVVLVVAALDEGMNLIGTIIGLLTLRISVYLVNIKMAKAEKKSD